MITTKRRLIRDLRTLRREDKRMSRRVQEFLDQEEETVCSLGNTEAELKRAAYFILISVEFGLYKWDFGEAYENRGAGMFGLALDSKRKLRQRLSERICRANHRIDDYKTKYNLN